MRCSRWPHGGDAEPSPAPHQRGVGWKNPSVGPETGPSPQAHLQTFRWTVPQTLETRPPPTTASPGPPGAAPRRAPAGHRPAARSWPAPLERGREQLPAAPAGRKAGWARAPRPPGLAFHFPGRLQAAASPLGRAWGSPDRPRGAGRAGPSAPVGAGRENREPRGETEAGMRRKLGGGSPGTG